MQKIVILTSDRRERLEGRIDANAAKKWPGQARPFP
jgi:hypothetical protein